MSSPIDLSTPPELTPEEIANPNPDQIVVQVPDDVVLASLDDLNRIQARMRRHAENPT
jgi:hypothetical protein